MAKIFLPSHIWLRFFCRAIYGSVKKTCEKNVFSSDFWSFFLKEKRRIFSSSEGRGKSIEIGGNNGFFRAPIRDRCPEGTSKKRESGKIRPFSDICPDSRFLLTFFSPSHFMARQKNLSHKWLGKKIFRSRKKFVLFLRLAFFFPSHLWLGKKIFRSRKKRTLVCRRKSQAIFDGRRGSPENSWNFRGIAEKGPEKKDLR